MAPTRLGASFRWLLASWWISNLGDGMALAAGPLLVASQTSDPSVVALAALLQRLPWLLFGLYAGVLADRLNRRLVVVLADGSRVAVLLALVATLITGEVNVTVVLLTMFLLGAAETFADTASSAVLPMIIAQRDLGIGNARLAGGVIVANQLAGPPVGAALFTAGRSWPFVTQAICVALGVLLFARIILPAHGAGSGRIPRVREDIREGWRWLWHHPPIRTLAITIFTFNLTFGCAWSVLVLYARERLGLRDVGFGLITTAAAVGGLTGTFGYGWLERHLRLATIMRAVLLVETLVWLVLALTRSPAVALTAFFCFGAEAFVWGTTSTSVRQRAVSTQMQGRVSSVYMLAAMAGLIAGAAVAGPLANLAGSITAPFWFAFAGSTVFLTVIWSRLARVAHADEQSVATS